MWYMFLYWCNPGQAVVNTLHSPEVRIGETPKQGITVVKPMA